MTKTISRNDLEYVLANAEVEYSAETVNDTYSGRGMYGETCLSVVFVGKRIQRNLCRFMVELGMAVDLDYVTPSTATELADDVCTDDLGMDMIVYFPGWKLDD
jgi:hypothetical protein